jgi:hypothetical protein
LTSDRVLKAVFAAIGSETLPLNELRKKTDLCPESVKRALKVLIDDFKIVEKTDLPQPTDRSPKTFFKARVGYRRIATPGKLEEYIGGD